VTRTIRLVIAAAVALILLLGFLQVRSCQQARQQAAQSRVDKAQTGAVVESAKDAIATQGRQQRDFEASEDLTKQNTKEITNAKGADIQIAPDVSAAGLASLCRRAAYRDHPRCRVQPVGPR
jgi:Flp pilus assembly protein TadB